MKDVIHKVTKTVDPVDKSGNMTNKKRYISIFTRPVATERVGIMAYDKETKLQS